MAKSRDVVGGDLSGREELQHYLRGTVDAKPAELMHVLRVFRNTTNAGSKGLLFSCNTGFPLSLRAQSNLNYRITENYPREDHASIERQAPELAFGPTPVSCQD